MTPIDDSWLYDAPPAPPKEPDEHREHQVIGPPGTGKTHYLSVQVQRLCADPRYGPGSVMIASLTRAAANEIADPRRTRLPKGAVGTLHAHCYRAFDRPQLAETPPGLRLWNEWLAHHGERAGWKIDASGGGVDVDYTPADWTPAGRGDGEKMLAELAVQRARMTPVELWTDGLRDFADRWAKFKEDEKLVDFTDLIERGISELPAAPGSPKVIMLDEAQDMSRLEFTLARQWARFAEQLVVVGDPWQNLYEWRGSDPAAFFGHDPDSRIILSRSRRVPAAVHEYATRWLGRSIEDGATTMELHPYEPRFNDPTDDTSGVAAGAVRRLRHTYSAAEGLWANIERDLADGESTVMVLASCGYMLEPLIKLLRERAIPFGNPYRPNHGGWNPLNGTERLRAFLRPDPDVSPQGGSWSWRDVHKWLDPMQAKGLLARGCKSRVKEQTAFDRFEPKDDQPADRPVPFGQIARLFADPEQASEHLFNLDVGWWHKNLLPERKTQTAYGVRVYDEHGAKALVGRPRLMLGTIHSVKGGEADHVYVAPDMSRVAWETGWFNPRMRAPAYRLFYVAFTRARQSLTLLAPASAMYVQFPPPQEA